MSVLQAGPMSKLFLIITLGSIAVGAMIWAPPDLRAQNSEPVALSGVVRSQQEGLMEGVIVSAKRDGANFSVSVVSDAKGNIDSPAATWSPANTPSRSELWDTI